MRTYCHVVQSIIWVFVLLLSVAGAQRGSRALLARVDQLQGNTTSAAAWDIPEQRAALLKLYEVTCGDHWLPSVHVVNSAAAAWRWNKRTTTYCRWPGVLCRSAALQLEQLSEASSSISVADSAAGDSDVVGLLLTGAGLRGTLPSELSQLVGLQVLLLADNPGLAGAWPQDLHFAYLEYLAVGNTSLTACKSDGTMLPFEFRSHCTLHTDFIFSTAMDNSMPGQEGVTCPKLALAASQTTKHPLGDLIASSQNSSNDDSSVLVRAEQQAAPPRAVWWWLLQAYGEHDDGGTIIASPSFFGAAGCSCMVEGQIMISPDESLASSRNPSDPKVGIWTCDWKDGSSPAAIKQFKQYMYIAALGSLVSPGVTALVVFLIYKRLRRVYLQYKTARSKATAAAEAGEMTMATKRSRFPGTPSVALAKGSGILSLSDVLVTWVVTDVEGSTQLWEWDAEVMGAAVELHNSVLRGLLEQFGGHEVRTDGDSFTLAFHDAADAVGYCVKAQEELLEVTWPPRLLEHPYCEPVHLGASCIARNHVREEAVPPAQKGKQLKDQGMLLMAGLRVRMGINTGVPDDIFVHDLTEHVEYRGEEYALTDDIAGIAAGGQILMEPKTFQRWNRVFSQAPADVQPAGDVLQVQHGDASCIEIHNEGNTQGGHGAGTLLHLPSPDGSVHNGQGSRTLTRATGSFLQRGLDMVASAFTAQLWRRQSDIEDPTGSNAAVSRVVSMTCGNGAHQQKHKHVEERSQNGATAVTLEDALQLLSSLGGATTVGSGFMDAVAAVHAEPVRGEETCAAAVVQHGNNLTPMQRASGSSVLQASSDRSAAAGSPPTADTAPAAASLFAGSVCKSSRWPAAAAAALAAARADRSDNNSFSSQECRSMSLNGSLKSLAASHKLKKPSVGGITFAIATCAASAGAAANNPGNLDYSGRQVKTAAQVQREHAISTGSPAFSRMIQRRVSLTTRLESSVEAARSTSPDGTRRSTKEEGHALRYNTSNPAGDLPGSSCPPAFASTNSRGHAVTGAQHLLPPSGGPVAKGVKASKENISILAAQQQAQEVVACLKSAEAYSDEEHAAGGPYASQHGAGPVAEASELPGAGTLEFASNPPVVADGRGFSGFTVASSAPSLSTSYATGLRNFRGWLGSAAGRISRRATSNDEHFQQIHENKSSGRSTMSLLGYIGRFASAAGTALKGSNKPSRDGNTEETLVHGRQPSILRLWSMRRRFSSPSADQQPGTPTSDAPELSTCQVVLLDLGFYQWKPDGCAHAVETSGLHTNAAAAVKAAAHQEVVAAAEGRLLHLVQVQSKRLAPRMLLFGWPLKACEGEDALMQQLLPGFLDAPGASALMFPVQRELLEELGVQPPAKPEVALAFVAPAGIKEVQAALGVEVAQACQALFTSIVREVLLAVGGYESKEVDGQVMAAFHGPRQAVEWAMALQCALLQAAWPIQLAQLKSTASARMQPAAAPTAHPPTRDRSTTADLDPSPQSHDGSTGTAQAVNLESLATSGRSGTFYSPSHVFKGVRARVGIWSGPMDRVLPHGKSGRADYLGPPANRAARMMGAAQGGQVLVEERIMKAVLDEWQAMEQQMQQQGLETTVAESACGKPAVAPGASLPASSCSSSHCTPKRGGQHRSLKQNITTPGARLFSNVFDNALYGSSPSLLSPIAISIKTLSLRPTAPWEVETAPNSGATTSSRLTRISADQPSGLGASTAGFGKPGQVLTITPAAYQPLAKRRATREISSYLQSYNTSGRNTSSSAGSGENAAPSATSDVPGMPPHRRSFTLTVSSTGMPATSSDILSQQQLPGAAKAGCMSVNQQGPAQRSNRRLSIGNSLIDVSELSKAVAVALGPLQPPSTTQRVRRSFDLQPHPCQQDGQLKDFNCSGSSQNPVSQHQKQCATGALATPSSGYSPTLCVSTASTPAGTQQQQLAKPLLSSVFTSALYSGSAAWKQQPQKVTGEVLVTAVEQGTAVNASKVTQALSDTQQPRQGSGHPTSYLARLLPPSAFLKAPAQLLPGNGTAPVVGSSKATADEDPQSPHPTSTMATCEQGAVTLDKHMTMQRLSSSETSLEASRGSSARDRNADATAAQGQVSLAEAETACSSASGTETEGGASLLKSLPTFSPIMRRRSQLSIVVDNPAAVPPQATDADTKCSSESHDADVEQPAPPALARTGLLAPSDVQLQVPGTAPGISNMKRPSLLRKASAGDEMLGHSSAASTPRVSGHSQSVQTPRSSLLGAPRRSSCASSSNVLSLLKDLAHVSVTAENAERGKQPGHQPQLHAQQGRSEISLESRGEGGTFAEISSSNGAAGLNSSSLNDSNSHSGFGSKKQFDVGSSCCTPTAASSNPMLQSLAKVRINRLLRRTDSKRNPAGGDVLNATFAPMSPQIGGSMQHAWRPNSTCGILATPRPNRRMTDLNIFSSMRSSSGGGQRADGSSFFPLPRVQCVPDTAVHVAPPVCVRSLGAAHAVPDSREDVHQLQQTLTSPLHLSGSQDGSSSQVAFTTTRVSKSTNGARSCSTTACQPIPEAGSLARSNSDFFEGIVQNQRMNAWRLFTAAPKSARGSGSQPGTTAAAAACSPISPGKCRTAHVEDASFGPARSDRQSRETADMVKATDPGVIAECFKIVSGAAGDAGSNAAAESITMIKFTALKQQLSMEDAELSGAMHVVPRLAMAAAAAAAVAAASSTSTSISGSQLLGSGSGMRSHFVHVLVQICVHRVGGFKLKGVDNIIEVVSVMPVGLEQRMQHLLPPTMLRGKSRCVAPASGLCGTSSAWLPDLSELVEWISAPILEQQPVWEEGLQLDRQVQQQQQHMIELHAQESKQQLLQHMQRATAAAEATDESNYRSSYAEHPVAATARSVGDGQQQHTCSVPQVAVNTVPEKQVAPTSKTSQNEFHATELELKYEAPEACYTAAAASASGDAFSIMAYHGYSLEDLQQQSQLAGADTQQQSQLAAILAQLQELDHRAAVGQTPASGLQFDGEDSHQAQVPDYH